MNDVVKGLNGSSQQTEPVDFFLTVNAPDGARVRILNIKPKYKDRILLRKGSYHIEVSKNGYRTKKQWIKLNDDLVMTVSLPKTITSSESTLGVAVEEQPTLIEPEKMELPGKKHEIVLNKIPRTEKNITNPTTTKAIKIAKPRNVIVLNKNNDSLGTVNDGPLNKSNVITQPGTQQPKQYFCEFYCIGNLGSYRGYKQMVEVSESSNDRAVQKVILKKTGECEKLPYYKGGGGKAAVGSVFCDKKNTTL